MGTTALVNGRIVTPLRIVDNGVVISRDDVIVDVGPAGQVYVPVDAQVIDVEGAYISQALSICMSTASGVETSCQAPWTIWRRCVMVCHMRSDLIPADNAFWRHG